MPDKPTNKELIAEYNAYFEQEPHRWNDGARIKHAYETIASFIPNPATLLDVGCGNGHALAYFRPRFPDTELTGLDLSDKGIEIAQKRVPYAVFVQGFIEEYEDMNTYQVVTCMGVAEHFRDLGAGLGKMVDLLDPDGICYLQVPDCLKYSPGEEGYRRLSVGSKQHEWHLNNDTWEKFILAAGFNIVRRYYGDDPIWRFIWVLGK